MSTTASGVRPLQRLGLALRGPGGLALVIGGALLLTAAGRHGAAAPPVPYRSKVAQAQTVRDPATGMALQVLQATMTQTTRATFLLNVEVVLRNRSAQAKAYSAGNLYALASSGQTYGATSPVASLPGLGSGVLPAGHARRGWIGFALAGKAAHVSLLWNDNNALIPPQTPAVIMITRRSTRGTATL